MPKIKGKFAPLLDELGYDPVFFELTDLSKLIYVLVLYTCYMTNNRAPLTPRYYQKHYNLRARRQQVEDSLTTISQRFPSVFCVDKKLNLIKSTTYEIRVAKNGVLEGEEEGEIEGEGEGKPAQSTPVIPKRNPNEIFDNKLFSELSDHQKQNLIDLYPEDFLTVRLLHYEQTAAKKKIQVMKNSTITRMLSEDFKKHEYETSRIDRRKKDDEEFKHKMAKAKSEAAPPPKGFHELKKKLSKNGVKK